MSLAPARRLKLAAALAAAALILAARRGDLPQAARAALGAVDGLGPWAPAAFVALYAAACVLFIPGSLLTLGAGAVFGLARGTAYVSAASVLGATASFLLGRTLARDWVSRRAEADPRFRAVDEAVGREGWKIVGLLRLSPLFPFNLLNYALGLTRVTLRDFVLASWLGMLPGTVMYVYIGSLAGDLARLGSGGRSRTPAEWALYAGGLAATAAVTVFVTRIAREALDKNVR